MTTMLAMMLMLTMLTMMVLGGDMMYEAPFITSYTGIPPPSQYPPTLTHFITLVIFDNEDGRKVGGGRWQGVPIKSECFGQLSDLGWHLHVRMTNSNDFQKKHQNHDDDEKRDGDDDDDKMKR